MAEAVERGRNGGGPSAIEAVAYRWHGHFEGDAQAYRDKAEIKRLRETADPLQIFRDRVLAEGALTAEVMDRIDVEVAEAVHQAVETALAAPVPDLSELLTDVYVSY
jgi:pyruvate dehydrogenase E1 component alpha subunit